MVPLSCLIIAQIAGSLQVVEIELHCGPSGWRKGRSSCPLFLMSRHKGRALHEREVRSKMASKTRHRLQRPPQVQLQDMISKSERFPIRTRINSTRRRPSHSQRRLISISSPWHPTAARPHAGVAPTITTKLAFQRYFSPRRT
ncbi:hypothetical protein BDW71DRAFT_171533 [Aspergillus fruticulosus]